MCFSQGTQDVICSLLLHSRTRLISVTQQFIYNLVSAWTSWRSRKAQDWTVVSNPVVRMKMKFCRIVLHRNTRRLTGSDFQYDVTLSRWRPWPCSMRQLRRLPAIPPNSCDVIVSLYTCATVRDPLWLRTCCLSCCIFRETRCVGLVKCLLLMLDVRGIDAKA